MEETGVAHCQLRTENALNDPLSTSLSWHEREEEKGCRAKVYEQVMREGHWGKVTIKNPVFCKPA